MEYEDDLSEAVEVADVLLVDDSELARAAMKKALTEAGVRVVDLPSSIGATRAILRHAIRIAVVDVNMPSLRGDRLVQLFRKNKKLRRVKLLLVSDRDEADLRALADLAKADDIVPKKEGIGCLVSKVKALLEG